MMKRWDIGMALGFGSIALINSLKVFGHLSWGLGYAVEIFKLAVLAALLLRAVLLTRRSPPVHINYFYMQFTTAAVISMLTDWAWLSTLH